MPQVRPTDGLRLRDIVSEFFACLGPLRSCEEPAQRLVEPVQAALDTATARCFDPARDAFAINPCGCIPGCGGLPSLPQDDTPGEQAARAAYLARIKGFYQYNYSLVRTFRDGQQGPGIAVLDSVPTAQEPSLWWVCLVLQQAIAVLDNLILVLEALAQPERRDRAKATSTGDLDEEAQQGHEPGLAAVVDLRPEEARQHTRDAHALRASLVRTLVWGRSITNPTVTDDHRLDPADQVGRPWETPLPPRERAGGSPWCGCLRCSPQSLTRDRLDSIKEVLGELVRRIMLLPGLDRRPYSIKAYNDLYDRVALPEFALWFQNDEKFALQRVAGQNPVVLRRIEWSDRWSTQFPVADEEYKRVMGADDALVLAGQAGRLYLCDYGDSLGSVIAGDFPTFAGKKYINTPLALFALSSENRAVIKAVAIQVGQEPERADDPDYKNPVFYPPDSLDDPRFWSWEIAKTIVQNADCNDSEFYRHLGLGHLLTEAFVLATYRALPTAHPLHVLLTPNFEGTLFTNNSAVTSINVEGSFINITEMIFAGTVDSTLGIAGNAVADVDYNDNMVPNNLRARGVDDTQLLPNYPYRDDAVLVHGAIRRWVLAYVSLYYETDRDVTGDYELQNWVSEVTSVHGGRIRGVGDVTEGRIETRTYLVDLLTEVIFTASAHHALTNFPLADYEIYEPGWPGALYSPPPQSATGATRRDWLGYLSKLNVAVLQQALGFTIGNTYFTRLGYYSACQFTEPRVAEVLAQFQADLTEVEQVINRRNETRVLRYPYLIPSRIPASINI